MKRIRGEPGDSTAFAKTLSGEDARLFSAITGGAPYNPSEIGRLPEFLSLTLANTVASMLAEAMGCTVLGMGFDWIHFLHPVYEGDTILAVLTVTERDEARRRLYAEIRLTNQGKVPVAEALILIKILDE